MNNTIAQERFFILTPTATGRVGKSSAGTDAQIYLDASGKEMWWCAPFSLPSIGQRIYVSMNGIGWADVKGYFESDGYLGVMTLALHPPEWLVNQRKRDMKEARWNSRPNWVKEGIGCEFGTEIKLDKTCACDPIEPKNSAGYRIDGFIICAKCKGKING